MNEVPQFPESALVLDLEPQALMAVLPPGEFSSDFQWLSLRTWNPEATVSQLEGAMIVGFTDYRDASRRFFGFTGGDEPAMIARRLLAESERLSEFDNALHLIPETTVEQAGGELKVIPDRDQFDYIYDVSDAAELIGHQHRDTRHELRRFERLWGEVTSTHVTNGKEADWDALVELAEKWAANTPERHVAATEVEAVKRCANIVPSLGRTDGIVVAVLSCDDHPVGFDVTEIIDGGRAIDHFRHTPHGMVGAQTKLRVVTAEYLRRAGVTSWNAEQDLGLPGLRARKLKYRPSHLLKKYCVIA